jgi:DNA-binding NtrC family response regulator
VPLCVNIEMMMEQEILVSHLLKTGSKMTRILVVDDDDDTVLTLRTGLIDNGFQVDGYSNPTLALANFKPNSYDIILTDIRMPRMNGFELVEEIRKRDCRIKACFISSFTEYYRSIADNLKLRCFIQKPVIITEIIEHIKMELQE